MTRTLKRGLLIAAAVVLLGGTIHYCSSEPADLTLPPWPPGVEQPDEYAFGDNVMIRDHRAWAEVFDALLKDIGRGPSGQLRVIHLTLPADADLTALQRYFDREMIEVRNWRAQTWKLSRGDAWVFGYRTGDGRHAVVLVGLKPRPGDRLVPLNVITTTPIRAEQP